MAGIANLFALIDQLKRNVGRNLQDPMSALELGLLRADEDFKADPVNTVLGNANIGGGLLGMTKMVKPPKAPQADALETARRNAVKMLGLPENNTAMDRARALGFDADVYHGSNKDFTEFDLSKIGTQTSMPPNFPKGIYTSPDTNVAGNYGKGEGSVIYTLLMNKKNPIKATDEIPAAEAFKIFNQGGADTFLSNNVAVARNPNQLRSRFAAFDPARRNEANLLASRILPLALPGLLFAGDEEE